MWKALRKANDDCPCMSVFDEIVDRNDPEDIKHAKTDGIDDLIPMWVADMDFKSPDEVIDNLVEQAKKGVFGYPEADGSYDKALIGWYKRRPAEDRGYMHKEPFGHSQR